MATDLADGEGDPVCPECEGSGANVLCNGGCSRSFHDACAGVTADDALPKEWQCKKCSKISAGAKDAPFSGDDGVTAAQAVAHAETPNTVIATGACSLGDELPSKVSGTETQRSNSKSIKDIATTGGGESSSREGLLQAKNEGKTKSPGSALAEENRKSAEANAPADSPDDPSASGSMAQSITSPTRPAPRMTRSAAAAGQKSVEEPAVRTRRSVKKGRGGKTGRGGGKRGVGRSGQGTPPRQKPPASTAERAVNAPEIDGMAETEKMNSKGVGSKPAQNKSVEEKDGEKTMGKSRENVEVSDEASVADKEVGSEIALGGKESFATSQGIGSVECVTDRSSAQVSHDTAQEQTRVGAISSTDVEVHQEMVMEQVAHNSSGAGVNKKPGAFAALDAEDGGQEQGDEGDSAEGEGGAESQDANTDTSAVVKSDKQMNDEESLTSPGEAGGRMLCDPVTPSEGGDGKHGSGSSSARTGDAIDIREPGSEVKGKDEDKKAPGTSESVVEGASATKDPPEDEEVIAPKEDATSEDAAAAGSCGVKDLSFSPMDVDSKEPERRLLESETPASHDPMETNDEIPCALSDSALAGPTNFEGSSLPLDEPSATDPENNGAASPTEIPSNNAASEVTKTSESELARKSSVSKSKDEDGVSQGTVPVAPYEVPATEKQMGNKTEDVSLGGVAGQEISSQSSPITTTALEPSTEPSAQSGAKPPADLSTDPSADSPAKPSKVKEGEPFVVEKPDNDTSQQAGAVGSEKEVRSGEPNQSGPTKDKNTGGRQPGASKDAEAPATGLVAVEYGPHPPSSQQLPEKPEQVKPILVKSVSTSSGKIKIKDKKGSKSKKSSKSDASKHINGDKSARDGAGGADSGPSGDADKSWGDGDDFDSLNVQPPKPGKAKKDKDGKSSKSSSKPSDKKSSKVAQKAGKRSEPGIKGGKGNTPNDSDHGGSDKAWQNKSDRRRDNVVGRGRIEAGRERSGREGESPRGRADKQVYRGLEMDRVAISRDGMDRGPGGRGGSRGGRGSGRGNVGPNNGGRGGRGRSPEDYAAHAASPTGHSKRGAQDKSYAADAASPVAKKGDHRGSSSGPDSSRNRDEFREHTETQRKRDRRGRDVGGSGPDDRERGRAPHRDGYRDHGPRSPEDKDLSRYLPGDLPPSRQRRGGARSPEPLRGSRGGDREKVKGPPSRGGDHYDNHDPSLPSRGRGDDLSRYGRGDRHSYEDDVELVHRNAGGRPARGGDSGRPGAPRGKKRYDEDEGYERFMGAPLHEGHVAFERVSDRGGRGRGRGRGGRGGRGGFDDRMPRGERVLREDLENSPRDRGRGMIGGGRGWKTDLSAYSRDAGDRMAGSDRGGVGGRDGDHYAPNVRSPRGGGRGPGASGYERGWDSASHGDGPGSGPRGAGGHGRGERERLARGYEHGPRGGGHGGSMDDHRAPEAARHRDRDHDDRFWDEDATPSAYHHSRQGDPPGPHSRRPGGSGSGDGRGEWEEGRGRAPPSHDLLRPDWETDGRFDRGGRRVGPRGGGRGSNRGGGRGGHYGPPRDGPPDRVDWSPERGGDGPGWGKRGSDGGGSGFREWSALDDSPPRSQGHSGRAPMGAPPDGPGGRTPGRMGRDGERGRPGGVGMDPLADRRVSGPGDNLMGPPGRPRRPQGRPHPDDPFFDDQYEEAGNRRPPLGRQDDLFMLPPRERFDDPYYQDSTPASRGPVSQQYPHTPGRMPDKRRFEDAFGPDLLPGPPAQQMKSRPQPRNPPPDFGAPGEELRMGPFDRPGMQRDFHQDRHYGPPPGQGPSRPDSRGPPDGQGPPPDARGHLLDSRGPLLDSRGPPPGRGPPHPDSRGPYPDSRGMPPAPRGLPPDGRGMPPDSRGLPPDARGAPSDARALLPDTRGMPLDSRGPLSDARGPPPDSRGPPPDSRGPPSDLRGGAPHDSRGPPRGPPPDPAGDHPGRQRLMHDRPPAQDRVAGGSYPPSQQDARGDPSVRVGREGAPREPGSDAGPVPGRGPPPPERSGRGPTSRQGSDLGPTPDMHKFEYYDRAGSGGQPSLPSYGPGARGDVPQTENAPGHYGRGPPSRDQGGPSRDDRRMGPDHGRERSRGGRGGAPNERGGRGGAGRRMHGGGRGRGGPRGAPEPRADPPVEPSSGSGSRPDMSSMDLDMMDIPLLHAPEERAPPSQSQAQESSSVPPVPTSGSIQLPHQPPQGPGGVGIPRQAQGPGWIGPQGTNPQPGISSHQVPPIPGTGARPGQPQQQPIVQGIPPEQPRVVTLGFNNPSEGAGKAQLPPQRDGQGPTGIGSITLGGSSAISGDGKTLNSSRSPDTRGKPTMPNDPSQMPQLPTPPVSWKSGAPPPGAVSAAPNTSADSHPKVSTAPGSARSGIQTLGDAKKLQVPVSGPVMGQGASRGRPMQSQQYQPTMLQSPQMQHQRPPGSSPQQYQSTTPQQANKQQQNQPLYQHQHQQPLQSQQPRSTTLSQPASLPSGTSPGRSYATYLSPGTIGAARVPSYSEVDVQSAFAQPPPRVPVSAPNMNPMTPPTAAWSSPPTTASSTTVPTMTEGSGAGGGGASNPWSTGSIGQVSMPLSRPTGASSQGNPSAQVLQVTVPGRQGPSPHGLSTAVTARVAPAGSQSMGVGPRGQVGIEQQPQHQQQVPPMNGGVQSAVQASVLPLVSGQHGIQNVQLPLVQQQHQQLQAHHQPQPAIFPPLPAGPAPPMMPNQPSPYNPGGGPPSWS